MIRKLRIRSVWWIGLLKWPIRQFSRLHFSPRQEDVYPLSCQIQTHSGTTIITFSSSNM